MISEILEATINEVLDGNKLEISEFQLGKESYSILKEEVESKIIGAKVNINSINEFMGIPVKKHNSDNAIVYYLKLRKS